MLQTLDTLYILTAAHWREVVPRGDELVAEACRFSTSVDPSPQWLPCAVPEGRSAALTSRTSTHI